MVTKLTQNNYGALAKEMSGRIKVERYNKAPIVVR